MGIDKRECLMKQIDKLCLRVLLATLVLFLGACTSLPADSEPAALPLETVERPTVTPVQDADAAAPEDAAVPEEDGQQMNENERVETPEAAPVEGVVSPVEVDVTQIPSRPPEEDDEPSEAPEPGVPDPVEALTRKAEMNLAERLDIDASQIEVVDVEAVQWNDSALGCPQPGMMYLQVITPGYRITLAAEGERYTYHTDRGSRVILCGPDGRPVLE